MRIKGKCINAWGTGNYTGEMTSQAEIELTPRELLEQITHKDVGDLLDEINLPKEKSDKIPFCECKEPKEYIERSSATGDKNYTGLCVKCMKPIKKPDKIEEFDRKDFCNSVRDMVIIDKINELIHFINREK